jgi:hypothetical protein
MKTRHRIVKWSVVFPVISALFLLNSCSYPHMYYSPNMMTVPLFKEAAEFSGTLSGSFGTVNSSFEMQTAFSLPAHIALGLNFMTGGNNNSGTTYKDRSDNTYFEGFGGFYSSFADIGIFEIYAGYGGGNQKHIFAYNDWDWGGGTWVQDGTAELNFSKFFIQPDIGVRTKIIEGAFSFRLSRLNFKEIVYANTNYRLSELQALQADEVSWLIEPSFTFRAGHDPVKFQIQGIYSANPSNPELQFEHFRFNLGLNIKFGKKKDNFDKTIPVTE